MSANLIPASRVETAVASADILGETPLWCDRSRKLWWIDIDRRLHQSFDPSTGAYQTSSYDCQFLGSQALTADGAHLLAQDLRLFRQGADGAPIAQVCEVEGGLDNRLNDGRVDARGRLWIGTMDNQLHRPNGSLYCVTGNGEVTRSFGDVIVTNGIAFSPDNRTLYFTDTRRYRTWMFDFDLDDGVIRNRRLFADYSSSQQRPDGACVDVDGGIWTAFFSGGRVARYRPNGEIDTVIDLPVTNPTCVCFGGSDLKTLFITSARKFLDPHQLWAEPRAGHLLAVHGIAEGLFEHRFVSSSR
ncbi:MULTISPECIES: SMP-30/gluconolactonase/LRE family protein [Bradyrhizobium]|jgi:sugar lactone lactonase YvrE|uniref:SMP-30/gluconolactonase/LRE family protein n=1 Tax=Bradyrhizobium TaxID=374 RepID=UPI001BAC0993|nr:MULTISPECIES: SMP-30/gluconolactonase/LRE family protein [Bradyrhizobium]MBR1329036.1 SMP-30/gluconolactonase/LRE family protein [Bradyrhizobium ottawaense]MBR1335230.1 SMP-30/gluconolactonase/LRE family protein [Bradyrhizobium ottawaense]MDA9448656.1 gluconolactonase [Bradyrhizobium sp. CCBAU 21360]MDA9516594.1 gluconolactonase [Bradyrhizobium sp. CCBAU 11430]